jgi:hypothetical protein
MHVIARFRRDRRLGRHQRIDVLLMTTYKNMATLDNLDDRMEVLTAATLNQNRNRRTRPLALVARCVLR